MKESEGETSQVTALHKDCFLPHSEGKPGQTSCRHAHITLHLGQKKLSCREAAAQRKKLEERRIALYD